jgi:hypothetical protein
MLKTLILVSLLLISATAARAENLAFVGRTQNTADVPNTSITLATPAGIQNGDMMLVFIASWNSTPMAPRGWTSLGSRGNSTYDVGAAFMKVWHTGNPTSYTFGNVNWPKAVMRVYRGVTGIDSSNFAANAGVSSFTIPALSATTAADDAYIAFFVSDVYQSPITGPADLADQTADETQWSSFDGDKIILNQGTEPPAEAAVLSSGTGDWIGFVITLANHPANLAFVGRTQNTANVPNTRITLPTPAGIRNNDVMLAFIASWNSTPTAPSGWTSLGSLENADHDIGAAFVTTWHTGNPTSYTFGNVNWPKAVMRVYRGETGVDSSHFAAGGGGVSSLTIPILSATTAADDAYVAFFVNEGSPIIGPSDLIDVTADQTQWASFDGDKVIANRGTVPPAETASVTSGQTNWIGFAVTLGNNASPPLLPYGNIAPPAGQSWYVTLDDEFDSDTGNSATNGISRSLWNSSSGAPSGQTWPGCTGGSDGNDVVGWNGATCGSQYFGTFGTAPYLGIQLGVGLIVQDLNNASAGPYADYKQQDWMSVQNYGLFTQTYGYFEISAKMPHDNAGEGDGLHPDIWIVPSCRFSGGTLSGPPCADEVDIAENDLGPATTNNVHWNVYDNNNLVTSIAYPYTAGDLSTAFHRYGLAWRNDGSGACGSFQAYFDGQPVGSPAAVNDSGWCRSVNGYPAGVYLLPGWMQETFNTFWGGAAVSSATSNSNPLLIQYVRVWQSH